MGVCDDVGVFWWFGCLFRCGFVFVVWTMGVCLGVERMVTENDIVNAIKTALQKLKKCGLMRKNHTKLIDGRGIIRIANLIIKGFEDKNG